MNKKLIYFIVAVIACSSCVKPAKRLPFLQQEITGTDTTYRTIPEFHFLNQDSTAVTGANFDGAIYVADFFFTSCPTICPVMHRNLLKVYEKYKGNPEVKLASHTIDAKYDTPSRMKGYADKLGVTGTQWEFLWGTRDSVYALAERNYLVSVGIDKKAPGGFVHQGYLVLVDKEKRIRGAYDGTDDEQVKQLLLDMDILLAEYKR
jgi:protein SCO1/2